MYQKNNNITLNHVHSHGIAKSATGFGPALSSSVPGIAPSATKTANPWVVQYCTIRCLSSTYCPLMLSHSTFVMCIGGNILNSPADTAGRMMEYPSF